MARDDVVDLKLLIGTVDIGPVAGEQQAHVAAYGYLERRARAACDLEPDGDWPAAWLLVSASAPATLVEGSDARAAVVTLAGKTRALAVGRLRPSWKVDSLDVGAGRAMEIQRELADGRLLRTMPEAREVMAIETLGLIRARHCHAPVVRDGVSAPKLGVFELLEDGLTDVLVHDPEVEPVIRALKLARERRARPWAQGSARPG